MQNHRYIAIEGPIGVGKTTLANRLAERLGGTVLLEQVEENPFLPSFYDDPLKYAFQAQMFFLLSRFQQQQALWQQDLFSQLTVSDYVFAKDRIFAALTLRPDEHALYERVASLLDARVAKPDLVVYLQARPDVLLGRIRKRGRDFERHIEAEYLEALSKAYSDFFFHYEETPLLVVNANDVDLAGSDEELDALIHVIRKHRAGTQHYVPMGTRTR
ncbi:MAG TPA: deoxynucleoside kinase [Anaeromyxobacteraceae bacterium]|nr:deoxynucleoside kinase [Anaeromyxobacteraceae bacterium]